MSVAALRATPLFASLSEADLERLVAMSEKLRLGPGELLIEEGSEGDALFVILAGELEVTKRSGTSEVPIARVGAGAIQGEMAALEGGTRMASVRAVTDVEALCVPRQALLDRLAAGPDAALAIIRTITGRLRSTESLLRQREKLAGLGTLAAGLAHELNNPAAAIRRSIVALGDALDTRNRARSRVDELQIAGERLRRMRLAAPPSPPEHVDPLTRSDRTDAIATSLADLPLDDPDGVAATLVDAGWEPGSLREALSGLDRRQSAAAVTWLAAGHTADHLLAEVRVAAERISEIVGAVKEYAFLDRAPVQRVDVKTGIENTLVILRHKLKAGIEVHREYAPDLPQIEAYGSELNQVWTNLIDNAADAMGGRGSLSIRAERADGGLKVTICDDGPGVPPEVLPRIFEPFYTTKGVGKGTGLGLHIAYSVVSRHGGRIDVESEPGRTCFRVALPALIERSDDAEPAADESLPPADA